MAKPKGKIIKIKLAPKPFKGKLPKSFFGKITGRK